MQGSPFKLMRLHFVLPRRSLSSILYLIFSLGAVLLLLLHLDSSIGPSDEGVTLTRVFVSVAVLFSILSIVAFLAGTLGTYRICWGVQFAVSTILAYRLPGLPYGVLFAQAILVTPAAIYERYPTSLILGTVASVVLALSHLAGEMLRPGMAVTDALLECASLAFLGALFSTFASLMSRFREEIIPLQRYLERLEDSVSTLTRANVTSQDYARDVEESSRLSERLRLTRDIHDVVGYAMTNTMMMMEAVKLMVARDPRSVPGFIDEVRSEVDASLAHIKQTLRNLRSQDELTVSMESIAKRLVHIFSLSTGVRVRYELGNVSWRSLELHRDIVYHFLQEGLINAFRHGKAREVILAMWEDGGRTQISLSDNGRGAAVVKEGIGIAGMRERAARSGGSIEIRSSEAGFRIALLLPSEAPHA